jgi:hypothetical protein
MADDTAPEESLLIQPDTETADPETPPVTTEETVDEPSLMTEPPADPETEEPAEPVVPEEYVFEVPEGVVLDETLVGAFTPIAKELGLTQESAQKLTTMYAEHMQGIVEAQQQAAVMQAKAWRTEFLSEPGHVATLTMAKKALASEHVGADFKSLVTKEAPWMADHPAVVHLLAKIGKLISEPHFVEGTPRGAEKPLADIMYDNPKK